MMTRLESWLDLILLGNQKRSMYMWNNMSNEIHEVVAVAIQVQQTPLLMLGFPATLQVVRNKKGNSRNNPETFISPDRAALSALPHIPPKGDHQTHHHPAAPSMDSSLDSSDSEDQINDSTSNIGRDSEDESPSPSLTPSHRRASENQKKVPDCRPSTSVVTVPLAETLADNAELAIKDPTVPIMNRGPVQESSPTTAKAANRKPKKRAGTRKR
ncbi:hypothetical protein NL676_021518 [Syzygium grande]|nr:hypothetical protein NL676_021518 [Syzygium grande]